MTKNLPLVVITLLAATLGFSQSATSPKSKNAGGNNLEQTIINISRENWEAYKNRDVTAMKAFAAEDFAEQLLEGPSNLEQDIANKEKLIIESYTVEDPKVTMVTKDVAILRYIWGAKGSFDGKPLRRVYVTEVWVSRGNKWKIISFSETPVS